MAYIENNEAPDNICISPTVPNLSKVSPIRVLRDLVPSVHVLPQLELEKAFFR
jgi:hypothetical protein